MNFVINRLARGIIAAGFFTFAFAAAAQAGGIERIDMKPEGIDLKQLEVHANASGYTGTVTPRHTFMLRLYAKAKGNDRVFSVKVMRVGKAMLFNQHAGKSEGWSTYAKSVNVDANINSVGWALTPKQACDLMLKNKVKDGMSKANVLKSDRKTTAIALFDFFAESDSKFNNKKNKHAPGKGAYDIRQLEIPYRVNVLCRAAL